MKEDRETRQKLLACAKKEFMDKGYTGASLRNICRQADVTTGALYFFFRDKADLFAALVDEPINRLYELMTSHYRQELGREKIENPENIEDSMDYHAAIDIIHYAYQHYDELNLVLTKSNDSGYENIIDRFVAVTEEHYRFLTDQICGQYGHPLLDDYTIHWISHMHIDTFVHMLTHEKSEEAACEHIKLAIRYLFTGFYGMIQS